MGWFKRDPLKPGEEKKVTFNAKQAGKVKRDKKSGKFVLYDTKGKKIGTANDEKTATDRLRKHEQRNQESSHGGGIPGQSRKPRPEGQSHKRKNQPGSGKNPGLWKSVKKDDDK